MSERFHFDYDLVVIGGGPAGQAACLSLNAAGDGRPMRVAVIDEQLRPGGQILRQPPKAFTVRRWLEDRSYRALKAQLKAFEALASITWLGGRSALGLRCAASGWTVTLSDGAGVSELTARRVLIAAGCYDMAVPLPGWTLPGVMSAGGVQAFVKSQRLTPGERIVLAGTHPLQLLVAEQIVEAGGAVALVAFAQSLSDAVRCVAARPLTAFRNLPQLLAASLAYVRLLRSGVSVRFGTSIAGVHGDSRVQSVRLDDETRIDCDSVGFCFGFLPQADLPRAAGLRMTPGSVGGWAVQHDAWMRSSEPTIYVAGETTGVKGAVAASAEGALAGLAIAMDEDFLPQPKAESRAASVRRRRVKALEFARLLDAVADPARFLDRWATPETLVCRCEDVDFSTLDAACAVTKKASSVKLISRCGMGVCQGRNCEHTLIRRLGDGQGDGTVGVFTARFPARPVRIGDMVPRR